MMNHWNIRKLTLRPTEASGEDAFALAILVRDQDVAAQSNSSSRGGQTEFAVTAQLIEVLRCPLATAKMFVARPASIVLRDLEAIRKLR